MKNKRQLRIFLRSNIEKESLEYFGMADDEFLDHVSDAWLNDKSNSQGRYQDIKNYIGKAIPKEAKILDMACGCGTFLFWGLLNGLDVYGIDPEEWKLEFNKYKCEVYGYPEDWNNRLIKGFGELLPFPDRYFDYVSSYQTLEHVNNVEKCLTEMLRVLRGGGVMFLKMPDYFSTFEGHYRVPWLPLFPRPLAKWYLKLINKPVKGLDTINYVTNRKIQKLLHKNPSVEKIIDQNKSRFVRKIQDRFSVEHSIIQQFLYSLYILKLWIHGLFRRESSINLLVVKKL